MIPPSEYGRLGAYAQDFLTRWQADEQWPALETASVKHVGEWTSFSGVPVIANWDAATDALPLFGEGARALALIAAVFYATSDEHAAELPIAVPVAEMTHAMLAQVHLMRGIAQRSGTFLIHQTGDEHTGYDRGTVTYAAYSAVWGEPPSRYWLDEREVTARRGHLAGLYRGIGMDPSGRAHSISFARTAQ